jgi:hypothetical protein
VSGRWIGSGTAMVRVCIELTGVLNIVVTVVAPTLGRY